MRCALAVRARLDYWWVYVDDLIITGNNDVEITSFKQQMSSRFKMGDLGLLSFYLGIEVKQGSDGISLS
jgi:hypothetical protein